MTDNWQDIKTAPKDGTPVSIYAKQWDKLTGEPSYRIFYECRFEGKDWLSGEPDSSRLLIEQNWKLVLWHPVPEPPKEAE